MPILTNPKHEVFAQEVARGKSASEAYRTAAGTNNRRYASELGQRPDIQGRVAELLAAREEVISEAAAVAIQETALTKEWIIGMLKQNVERAMTVEAVRDAEGQPTGEYKYNGAVANRALELLGKERGMFIDRSEVGLPGEFERLDDVELRDRLLEKASELGINLPGNETSH